MSRQLSHYNPVLPGLVPDADADQLCRSFHVVQEGQQLYIDRMPSRDERVRLAQRSEAIAVSLRPFIDDPAGKDQAAKVLADMLMAYSIVRSDPNSAQVVGTYVHHLREIPMFALRRACDDIRQGRVFDLDPRTGFRRPLDPDYPPSTVRVRQVADKYINEKFGEKLAFDRVLRADRVIAEQTEEQRRRIGGKMSELHDYLNARDAEFEAEQRQRAEADGDNQRRDREAAIRREYGAMGLQVFHVGDTPVSLELARTLGEIRGDKTEGSTP